MLRAEDDGMERFEQMCLGIPGQVVQMLDGYGGHLALVDVAGETRKVNVGMLSEETFSPGDWVIIHMGFVVDKTDEAGAERGDGRPGTDGPGPRGAGGRPTSGWRPI